MATKYQAKKVINALSEAGAPADPNIQGFGVSTAKAQGIKGEDGYVVVVYVADMKEVQAQKEKALEGKSKADADKPEPEIMPQTEKAKGAKSCGTMKAKKKTKPELACMSDYPETVKTTSRSKDVKVPVAYVETGAFGFNY